MQHAFNNMIDTCDRLAEMMAGRGLITPSAEIGARSGQRTAHVTLRFAKPGESYPNQYEFHKGDTLAEAVRSAEAWIRALPSAGERELRDALELTAKALEASRKAGLDAGEGAAFVSQLEAMMKRLSENAIADQSEAR